jgi:hypothetical protein
MDGRWLKVRGSYVAHVNMYPVNGLADILPDHLVSDGHVSILYTIKQG